MGALLSDSPFEFFIDCVGLVLIVIFSFGVADDLAAVRALLRG